VKRPKFELADKARLLASKYQATLESANSISRNQKCARFSCLNGHIFYLPIEQVDDHNQSSWCTKCSNFYKRV